MAKQRPWGSPGWSSAGRGGRRQGSEARGRESADNGAWALGVPLRDFLALGRQFLCYLGLALPPGREVGEGLWCTQNR